MTTQDSLAEKIRQLNTSNLPQTFNDVFQVAMNMNIRFVWVDSLCIVQDDPVDWTREASLMSQVYRNAYFTLAAAVPTPVPSQGIFRDGDPADISSVKLSCTLEDESSHDVVVMKSQPETFNESPLVSRGWCFQEREISQRLVHYTETQVLWECRTLRASEALPNGSAEDIQWPGRLLDHDLHGDNLNRAWLSAIADYFSRDLTKVTDTFPALAGLAASIRIYKPTNCRYLAGIWEDNFISGLAWYSTVLDGQFAVKNERHPVYIAPTWS